MLDNSVYDRRADTWWEEGGFLNFLKSGVNPVRFGYMRRVLIDELAMDPTSLKALDVGCGGGLLAEEFARLGCQVTGVDPSVKSIEVARQHAKEVGLQIDYQQGTGEALPVPDAAFDLVYCCDVLEHVADVGATLKQIARSLKPGGVFFYDTINRTRRSNFVYIKLSQVWKGTAWADPGLHDWDHFIRPVELDVKLRQAGLEGKERVGFAPKSPIAAVQAFRARAKGEIDYAEMGERLSLRVSGDLSGSYGGWAIKTEG
ncbi:bifunctional 2-polyprenyl-6-hydroxyphenol methylase/3-demethylubiquinol 3-O-methyltransferase UbiG [Streptomyces tendae]|uniref:bifunctional 2-polyprenyl-6-hydroxyphenol methylase/3-demethylubiquinol 3-O-methyltransferase UbiG n=1 Tax=Streptomyces tendae TaxID=1932 RepID=UPI003D751B74